ncbi:MAG: phosphoribosyltransferase [Anaerolineae bacterium]
MFSEDYLPQEVLTWDDVDRVIDHLLPQFNKAYDAIVMITRGGLFPGGILCEVMGIQTVHTAAVHFAATPKDNMAWPTFMQFPIDTLVTGKQLLVVDDLWAEGINIVVAKSRLEAAGANVETAVLHFRPKSNLFPDTGPDYYGAITNRYIIYPWSVSPTFPADYFSPPQNPTRLA